MQQPIRIAHIIGKWLGGGVESVVMNYYRHIDREKVQFDFICDSDSTNIPYDEIEKLGGKVILIPPYQKVFKYHRELKKILKQEGYKIVHSHINVLSVFSLFAAKKAGVPIRIAHSHSTTNRKEWKKNIVKIILRPFSTIYATEYFACTEHAGKWMFGKKNLERQKIHILNNAIDLDKFKRNEKNRKLKRKELGVYDDEFIIGHVGRFVSQKNHEFLIDVFKKIHDKNSNARLMLIGQGPLMERVKNKIENLELTEFVTFLGQRLDVCELYQTFDMFVLPSIYEGLGMVLVEAQAAGVPCIASTEVPDVAKVAENFLFLSLSAGAEYWAEQIINKPESREEKEKIYDKLSRCGFNIKLEAKKLLDYYLAKSNI